ncbi:DgyrCDS13356 [Dimorphilus gyrociliatus]|uniref:DgyrCDS13356 n=1 Tax=Dimorphilus gyrociliatus TaxID=2664684 RepID=A0A7I8WAE4_9ANNE|nr:DgyrCDS13356 [Dimorphilus gyrociliatus]
MEFVNATDNFYQSAISLEDSNDLFVVSPDLFKDTDDSEMLSGKFIIQSTNTTVSDISKPNAADEEFQTSEIRTKRRRKPTKKYQDDLEDITKARPIKRRVRNLPAKNTPEHYELRRKNNEAVRRSRLQKKKKELEKDQIIEEQIQRIQNLENALNASKQEKLIQYKKFDDLTVLLRLIEIELKDPISHSRVSSLIIHNMKEVLKSEV